MHTHEHMHFFQLRVQKLRQIPLMHTWRVLVIISIPQRSWK